MNGLKELVEMAHEAGLCDKDGCDDDSIQLDGAIKRFAELVAAQARKEMIDEFAGLGEWHCVNIIKEVDS